MERVKVILDQNINVMGHNTKVIEVNGVQTTYNNPQNNGSILGGQILFNNITLPTLTTSVISRNMRIRYRVQVSSQGTVFNSNDSQGTLKMNNPNIFSNGTTETPGTGNLPLSVPVGVLRPFPLSTCTDTATLTINGVPISVSLRQVIPAILRTIPKEYLEKQASECPSMIDNAPCLTSDDMILSTIVQSNQPLSVFQNCNYGSSRGSFFPVSYQLGGTPTANDVAIFEVCEPIFVPPCSLYDDKTFFANVQTLSYQMNYSLLNDMVVYGIQAQALYPENFLAVLIDNSARLEYSVITLDSRVVQIPRVVSYDFSIPQYFPTRLTDFTFPYDSGNFLRTVQNTGKVYSQALRLSYMPGLIYIYAHLPVNIRAAAANSTQKSYADCFFSIGDASGQCAVFGGSPNASPGMTYNTDQIGVVSIELNNRQGLLSGASIKDLFRIACSNGYPYSYTSWLVNPVVIVNPLKDLGLDLSSSDIYPNQNGNVTLTVQASFNTWNYCSNSAQVSYLYWTDQKAVELMVVCLQDGVCEISPDTVIYNYGSLSAIEVKHAIEDYKPLEKPLKSKGKGLDQMFDEKISRRRK